MRLKGLLALSAALALLTGSAAAEALQLKGELAGILFYPDEENPIYRYTYAYPVVEALADDAQEAAEAINELYAYTEADTIGFTLPVNGSQVKPDAGLSETVISYEITCSTDEWFSVLVRNASHINGFDSLIYSGHVFAVHSDKPGNVITLPYLLRILAEDENDTWLQDRQTARADACVRTLVWEALNRRVHAGELTLLEGMDEEWFEAVFYPEEDFYLDEAGEPVFFLEPGFVVPEEAGLITFPLTVEEILDEL